MADSSKTSYSFHYFSNNLSHKWKLTKHNANENANTERVEEKLLYLERWLLVLNLFLCERLVDILVN